MTDSSIKPLSESEQSVVTCDLEGRIETFNDDAESIFGWSRDEIVGKKRVSLFSPGLIVLGHVGNWLATAVKEGEYKGRTVFLRKDGSKFAADIRITPTWKKVDGEKVQIGFCGVTNPLPSVKPEDAMPSISFAVRAFRWLVITRAPFLTATLVPILIGAAWVMARSGSDAISWWHFVLTVIGGLALHVAANTFNDYFDWLSGADEANNEYFMPFSGGSRAIELGLIDTNGLRRVAWSALAVAALAGLPLLVERGISLLLFGVIGAFAAYFYTAPPLRLVARKGLGELFVGSCFGPLMTAGTVCSLTGVVSPADFLVGVPVGLLTTAILWINEFPDAPSDEKTGKLNLVVVLGKAKARWGYLALQVVAFALIVLAVVAGIFPTGAILFLVGLPLAYKAVRVLFKHYEDRELVSANVATIQLQLVSGLAMAAGLAWGKSMLGMVGL